RLLAALQTAFRAFQRKTNKHAFEEAAYDFLRHHFHPTANVLLEGFTHFDPLHELLLATCARDGATVYLVHPYRAEQGEGFASMDRAYARFASTATPRPCQFPWQSTADLVLLQQSLFAPKATGTPRDDGSVTVEAYSHRHQEVAACIRRIQTYLRSGVATHE